MLSTTPYEIISPYAPIASTDPVPTTDAPDSVQQEIPCLPTSASWDDFLLDIAEMFVESHIEDVRDILNDINLLFVEETSSLIARAHSDPQPLDHYNMFVDISLQHMEKDSFTY